MALSQAALDPTKDVKSAAPSKALEAIGEHSLCPISTEPMKNPVMIDKDCCHIFDREQIEDHYRRHTKDGSLPFCPVCGANATTVATLKLTPVRQLKEIIALLPSVESENAALKLKVEKLNTEVAQLKSNRSVPDKKQGVVTTYDPTIVASAPPLDYPLPVLPAAAASGVMNVRPPPAYAPFKQAPLPPEAYPPPPSPRALSVSDKKDVKSNSEPIKRLIGLRWLQRNLRHRFATQVLGINPDLKKNGADNKSDSNFIAKYRTLRLDIKLAKEQHLANIRHKAATLAMFYKQLELNPKMEEAGLARIEALERELANDRKWFKEVTLVGFGKQVKSLQDELAATTYQFAIMVADHKRLEDKIVLLKKTIAEEREEPLKPQVKRLEKSSAFFEKLALDPSNQFKTALNNKKLHDAKEEERTRAFISALTATDNEALNRARALLKEGVNVDRLTRSTDAKSLPLFMQLVREGKTQAVLFLIKEARINVNRATTVKIKVDNVEWPIKTTPLMIAAYYQKADSTLPLLLNDAKANVNLAAQDGKTALHFSCIAANYAATKILLDGRADKLAIDEKYKSPLNLVPDDQKNKFCGLFGGANTFMMRL